MLRQVDRACEPAEQAAAPQVFLKGFAGVVAFPVPAQGQVEGGHGAAQGGDREAEGEHHPFEVDAGGPGEIDAQGQDPLNRPGRGVPLCGTTALVGERGLYFAGEGGFADAADAVADQDVVPRARQILDVEGGVGDSVQVVGERGDDGLPLGLAVGEGLFGRNGPVIYAEQHP
ncbi:hypothetical protein [Streptomyces nigrescens]